MLSRWLFPHEVNAAHGYLEQEGVDLEWSLRCRWMWCLCFCVQAEGRQTCSEAE